MRDRTPSSNAPRPPRPARRRRGLCVVLLALALPVGCAGLREPEVLAPERIAIEAVVLGPGGRAEVVFRERGGVWRRVVGARVDRSGGAAILRLMLPPWIGDPPAVDVPALREGEEARLVFERPPGDTILLAGEGSPRVLLRNGRVFLPD